ncbi:MAG: VacJ family lipoprotein [Pseudomonadota bacterium]|nr:VacJ family lipoprotein [Pseudomonadota bacterium]
MITLRNNTGRLLSSALFACSMSFLTGCAVSNTKNDPFETYNRAAFKFNHYADIVVGRPLADIYIALLPGPVQTGVTNIFNNFYEPSRVINDLLQARGCHAIKDTGRFVINTTIGVAGIFDVAQRMGLPGHTQDLGITFARWGWRDSAYFIVPFFGIYTVRDMIAAPINSYAFTPYSLINPESLSWQIYGLDKLHDRAAFRPADKVIDESFDPYIFVRNAYTQKRQEQINGDENIAKAQTIIVEDPKQDDAGVSDTKTKTKEKSSTNKKNLPDIISQKDYNKRHA